MIPDTIGSGAEFSRCKKYRYVLWRRWAWDGYASQVMFIGLNPSTADATTDDPTIRRCIGFAKDWGYGGILMLNAFAFRATDPKAMLSAEDPIGPYNDDTIAYWRSQNGLIVAAWGDRCPITREHDVCRVIGANRMYCIGTTKSGAPKHPLEW